MAKGMTAETRERVLQEQAELTARRWRERVTLGEWTIWELDDLNWVIQPKSDERDSRRRSFFPTFRDAMLAAADRVTGAQDKRTAKEFAAACELVRAEVRQVCA